MSAKLFGLKPGLPPTVNKLSVPCFGLGEEKIVPRVWPPLTKNGTWPLQHIKIIYDQSQYNDGKGIQGCTGYALSELMTIWWWMELLGHRPRREMPRTLYNTQLFCPWWLYHRGQLTDPDPKTTPEADNGAYLWYVLQVLINEGHVPWMYNYPILPESQMAPTRNFGIEGFSLCTSVEQIRAGLSEGPMVGGIAYHDDFMWPRGHEVTINGIARTEYWIGEQDDWGGIPGYHAVCICGGEDDSESVLFAGTWGLAYKIVRLLYRGKKGATGGLERLLEEGGEFYSIKFLE